MYSTILNLLQRLIRQFGRWLRDCIAVILLFVTVVAALLTAGGYQTYERALLERPIAQVVRKIQSQPSYTPLAQVPQIYKNAVIAAEDHRFYHHNGIDLLAIADALVRDFRAGEWVAGGSTITQQLCKNQFFTQKKQFTRKIAEVFMVRDIEQRYTKDEILELYINSIYYGSGYYTLADASQGYFGKAPAEMNDWECTLLAGVPNAPSAYAPTVNGELALQRQRQVLDDMLRYGYLTVQQVGEIVRQCPDGFVGKQS